MLKRFIVAVAIAVTTHVALAKDEWKVTLDVKGMDCATCPLTVKVLLKNQPGVSAVTMDADKKTATVEFDAAKVTPGQLASAVTEAGYPTTPRM